MQNDLQDGIFVLLLAYSYYTIQDETKSLISKSNRGACTHKSDEIANKAFFMLARNVSMEAIDGC